MCVSSFCWCFLTCSPLSVVEFPRQQKLLFGCEMLPHILLQLSDISLREFGVEDVDALVNVSSEGVASPVTSQVDVDSGFAICWVTRPIQPVFVSEDDGPPNPHDAVIEFHFFALNASTISLAPSETTIHEPFFSLPTMPCIIPSKTPSVE